MKWLSPRISFHRHKDKYTTLIISTKVDKWKESLIFGWLCLWTLVGLFMLYFLATGNFTESMLVNSSKKDLQLYLIIFLVFWGLFEYRVARVYLWRKKGMEYFKISPNKITIKKAFGKYGKANEYLLHNIDDIELIPQKQNGYARVMSGSFWDLGNETVSFDYLNKKIIFGKQLEAKEAKSLANLFKKEITYYKKMKNTER